MTPQQKKWILLAIVVATSAAAVILGSVTCADDGKGGALGCYMNLFYASLPFFLAHFILAPRYIRRVRTFDRWLVAVLLFWTILSFFGHVLFIMGLHGVINKGPF